MTLASGRHAAVRAAPPRSTSMRAGSSLVARRYLLPARDSSSLRLKPSADLFHARLERFLMARARRDDTRFRLRRGAAPADELAGRWAPLPIDTSTGCTKRRQSALNSHAALTRGHLFQRGGRADILLRQRSASILRAPRFLLRAYLISLPISASSRLGREACGIYFAFRHISG